MPEITTKIEFVLQHLNDEVWREATIPNDALKPVVDYAIAIRRSSPLTKQRIIRRVTEVTDEVLINESNWDCININKAYAACINAKTE